MIGTTQRGNWSVSAKTVHDQTWSSNMAQEIKKTATSTTPTTRYVDPFSAMRAEMDRVFDSFLGPSFGRFPLLSRRGPEDVVVPSIDVRETESELVVEAEA
jgi:HSP20 family molecular chaperone IbpA